MTYAINKKNLGERALSPISPDSWAYNPQVKDYLFDLQKASEILKDLPSDVGKTKVTLITTPELLTTAEKIGRNWSEIGIETSVVISSFVPSEFQAYLTVLDIPTDPDQYSLWHSTQTTTNISKYVSPRIDKLLEEGRKHLVKP